MRKIKNRGAEGRVEVEREREPVHEKKEGTMGGEERGGSLK